MQAQVVMNVSGSKHWEDGEGGVGGELGFGGGCSEPQGDCKSRALVGISTLIACSFVAASRGESVQGLAGFYLGLRVYGLSFGLTRRVEVPS